MARGAAHAPKRHHDVDRGDDAYFSPPEAAWGLLKVEQEHLRGRRVWEPACGDGALVRQFRAAGLEVDASDIRDRGCPDSFVHDFLDHPLAEKQWGTRIITNPPYKRAVEFIECALVQSPYVAMLLRLAFLEGQERASFFRRTPLAAVWVFSGRLPMMHRAGWEGPKASSSTAFAWFVWDRSRGHQRRLGWIGAADIEDGKTLRIGGS